MFNPRCQIGKITDSRHCKFHLFCYFCPRKRKKGSRMSGIRTKNRKFAPLFFGMTDILSEAYSTLFQVDESRHSATKSGIRENALPKYWMYDMYIPPLGREPFSYLISGRREPVNWVSRTSVLTPFFMAETYFKT